MNRPKDYLPDATDFTDMVKKELPGSTYPSMSDYTIECPKCHGYGGWNLKLNAYGKPGDAPNMRHFRAFCSQCWGWGWVEPGLNADCLHEFKEIAPDQPWRCWHTIECVKCGHKRSYDSSD